MNYRCSRFTLEPDNSVLIRGWGIKVLLTTWWPEGEVPSEGALFSSGFVILMICDFLYSVYTFKRNYCKLSTDLNHRHKPSHWTLCFFFLPPSLWHLYLLLYLCACVFARSFQSHSFSSHSFPFLSFWSMSFYLLSCFLSLFEHPNHCQVSHWVTKIKAEFLSPWAYDWMSVSSGDLTSSKSFKHIDSFPMESSTSGVVVSSPRWTKNGTAESLMLVSSISFCQLNYTTAHTTT